MKTKEEIEETVDWLEGHFDAKAPERFPIVLSRNAQITTKQVLRWVLDDQIKDSTENLF